MYILVCGCLLLCNKLTFATDHPDNANGFFLMSTDSTSEDGKAFKRFLERTRVGGNIGAQFGTFTMVDLSPNIAYYLTEQWRLGLAGTYRYFNFRDYNLSGSVYGGGVFTQHDILESFMAHAEYEVLNGPWDGTGRRFNVTSLLIGGGYSGQVGGRLSTNLLILYNLNDSVYSPYTNPVIRAGFGFDL